MHRSILRRGLALGCVALALALGVVAGCSDVPSVSSSDEKVTVKGVVSYQGKPVKKGTISFDPSNVNRPMATAASGPIKDDGSYEVTTLAGQNMVSFDLPGLATPKNRLGYTRFAHEVKAGAEPYNIELPAATP